MEQKSTWMFVTLIIISLIIFFLDRAGFLFTARGFLEGIIAPPAGEVHKIISTKTPEQKQVVLEEQQGEIEKLKKENEDLRLALGIAKSDFGHNKLMLAHVLSTSRAFIIDRGVDDGVRVGNTVVFKNIFVGKIINAGKKVSKVLLPTDSGSLLRARILQTKALGLLKGGGQEALFSEVILSENLTEGDTILTVGDVDEEELGIWPDLLVGTITHIRKSENQLFQEAKVLPFLDYSGLKNVFVVQ